MRIVARAPDAAAFAPFGAFVDAPDTPGDRRMFSDWLVPVAGLSLQFHLNHVPVSALPLSIGRVEQHPHAAQVFLPVNVSRYLVTVMPANEDGRPDPARTLSFVVPGRTGVIYRPGAWHAGMTVLDRAASFAVLMWRGAEDDDVFAPIPTLNLAPPPLGQTGTDA